MRVHNPDDMTPKKWTYIPTNPADEPEEECPRKWKWFKEWMTVPFGIVLGLSFCFLWPLWIVALMFAIAPFTGWNPSHKKE